MKERIVMKFGGTSVGSPAAIQRAVSIIQKHKAAGQEIVVVVSAAAGVTNALNLSITQAIPGTKGNYGNTLSDIQTKLEKIASDLLHIDSARQSFSKLLTTYLIEARQACKQIAAETGNLPQLKDQVLSIGERIQIHLVTAALQQQGIHAIPVSAAELIVTNDVFQEAVPQQPATDINIQSRLNPLLQADVIPVITGFVGATEAGVVTTLGRGGSDYSAAILAAGLNANELWIWTDVDGILTTDPELVNNAQLISEISYPEVYDLAFFGARVLHPKTILPLEGKGIPVRIKNTFNEENQGTHIHVSEQNAHAQIKAITGIKQVSIISIRKRRYEDFGTLITLIENALEETQIHVLGVFQDANKDNAYLAIKDAVSDEQLAVFEQELAQQIPGRDFPRLQTRAAQTLITAVGHQIEKNPLLSSKLKFALAKVGVSVRADACRNTSHSLSFLISEQDHLKAIQQLHKEVLSHAAVG